MYYEKETYDAILFQEFLGNVLDHYSEGKILMILDNDRICHVKILRSLLEQHENRIELGVGFSSTTQFKAKLMEELWKWLKETAINNVFYSNVQQIILAVRAFPTGSTNIAQP